MILVIDFTQFLLFIQSSETGLFTTCYFTTGVCNALQIILVFLADVPKPTLTDVPKPTDCLRVAAGGH